MWIFILNSTNIRNLNFFNSPSVYNRLYYCTVIKENHNAEKAFSVTMFRFEMKIIDVVCGKQPRTANVSCVKAQ